jgi:hypothetical protein
MDDTTKPRSGQKGEISRREFARRAAIASAIATVAPAVAVSTPASPPTEHATVAAADRGGRLFDPSSTAAPAEQQPADLPKLSPESHVEAEARLQTVLAQYGSRFSDAQKTDIRRLCFLAQPPLDRLRAYALDNGDSPALYFKPLVEREKNPLENTRVGKTPDAAKKP